MSKHLVSAETAREMLSWWEPSELAGRQAEVARDYGTIYAAAPELAATVIAQAEQIKRLQAYIRQLESSRDYQRYIRNDSGLKAGDMEDADE